MIRFRDELCCAVCTRPLERVDDYAYMCVPCRRNIYWDAPPTEILAALLREAAEQDLTDGDMVDGAA